MVKLIKRMTSEEIDIVSNEFPFDSRHPTAHGGIRCDICDKHGVVFSKKLQKFVCMYCGMKESDNGDELKIAFDILKNRIITHREKCKTWKKGKPCFDCHVNTLTRIERVIKKYKKI